MTKLSFAACLAISLRLSVYLPICPSIPPSLPLVLSLFLSLKFLSLSPLLLLIGEYIVVREHKTDIRYSFTEEVTNRFHLQTNSPGINYNHNKFSSSVKTMACYIIYSCTSCSLAVTIVFELSSRRETSKKPPSQTKFVVPKWTFSCV